VPVSLSFTAVLRRAVPANALISRGQRAGPFIHRGGLDALRGGEVPSSARVAEVRPLRTLETTPGIRARDRSQRDEGVPPAVVRDLRADEHDDVLGLVALGELTSRPVRTLCLKAISHMSLEGPVGSQHGRAPSSAEDRGPDVTPPPWATVPPSDGVARRLVAQAARTVLAEGRAVVCLHAPDNEASARVARASGFPDTGWQGIGYWSRQP
jgi:hypothetical protein